MGARIAQSVYARYGLDGARFECQQTQIDFSLLSNVQTGPMPRLTSYSMGTMGTGVLPRG